MISWLNEKVVGGQENSSSLASRVKKSDAREIQSFYQQYYQNYVRALDKGEQADRYTLFLIIPFFSSECMPLIISI